MTGLPASGKGTFKDLLQSALEGRGVPSTYYSLSDVLREEARFRGLTVDRDVLRKIGHELRLKYGGGVLSERVLSAIAADRRQGSKHSVVVVDAIRNPSEVDVLRRALDDGFRLVGIEAPSEAVVERMRVRARAGDVVDSDELAGSLLKAEMGFDEPEYGHNIAECLRMADVIVENRGTLADLSETVDAFIDAQVTPYL